MRLPRRARVSPGQAMVEFALIVPLALLLVLGGFDLSVMGSDKVIAISAARHGARVASELGGSTDTSKSVNTCNGTRAVNQSGSAAMVAVDQTILQTVLGAFGSASFVARNKIVAGKAVAQPDEIVIYHPLAADADGKFDGGPDQDGKEGIPDGTTVPGGSSTSPPLRFAAVGHMAYEQYLPVDGFTTNQNFSGHKSRAIDGGTHTGVNYKLTDRCQGPLSKEAEIGVMVIWTYKPVNGVPGPKLEWVEYSVEKASLCNENCVTS